MSDAPATPQTSSVFTERELTMLGWAMQSLKSGPPEIDYEKLAQFAGMSNPKSAANAWAKIKVKLFAGGDLTPPKTPKVKPATPRKPKAKAPAKATSGGDEGAAAGSDEVGASDEAAAPETPTKTKKTPTPRKRKTLEKSADGEDGKATTPKKRGRKTKAQKEAEAAEAAKGVLPDIDVAAAINDDDTEATTMKGEEANGDDEMEEDA